MHIIVVDGREDAIEAAKKLASEVATQVVVLSMDETKAQDFIGENSEVEVDPSSVITALNSTGWFKGKCDIPDFDCRNLARNSSFDLRDSRDDDRKRLVSRKFASRKGKSHRRTNKR